MRLSHYTDGKLWDVTTGLSPRPEADEHYVGDPLSEADTRRCFSWHVTAERAARDRKGPVSADRGIGCERCHGPGEHHILAVNARFPDMAIAEPGKASGPQVVRLCAQCHSIRGLVTPDMPAVVRFPGTTLTWSRCYTGSNGALGCTSCHDPHRDVSTSASYYEARCLGCHAPQPAGKTQGTAGSAASTCPVNAAKGCVECHMPEVRTTIPHSIFTDHHIRVHRAQDETE